LNFVSNQVDLPFLYLLSLFLRYKGESEFDYDKDPCTCKANAIIVLELATIGGLFEFASRKYGMRVVVLMKGMNY